MRGWTARASETNQSANATYHDVISNITNHITSWPYKENDMIRPLTLTWFSTFPTRDFRIWPLTSLHDHIRKGGVIRPLTLTWWGCAFSLDQEVTRWKDRSFFGAMDAEDEDLCEDCKRPMCLTFYDNEDRTAALKWRPGQGSCVWRNCRYYKQDCMDSETT